VRGAARAVLSGFIDYAGLFPPASQSMRDAVRSYAAYRCRPDGWALGRFVVPAARLREWEEAVADLPADPEGKAWPLSCLLGPDRAEDLATITGFRDRSAGGTASIAAVEARVETAGDVEWLRSRVGSATELYLEVPRDGTAPVVSILEPIQRAGAYAKVRAGGIRAEEIPPPGLILRFLEEAARRKVPFKATAGLHHPVRRMAPLTYAPGSASALMFGYLNVVLAATVLWARRPADEAERFLLAQNPATLAIGDASLCWEGLEVSVEEIARARREFMRSMGSCSFTEPVEEIPAT